MLYHVMRRKKTNTKVAYEDARQTIKALISGLEEWLVNIQDTNLAKTRKAKRIKDLVDILRDMYYTLPKFRYTTPEWAFDCTYITYKHRNKNQEPTRRAQALIASNALASVAEVLKYYLIYERELIILRTYASKLSQLAFPRMYG